MPFSSLNFLCGFYNLYPFSDIGSGNFTLFGILYNFLAAWHKYLHRFTAHFSFSIIHLKMKRKHSFYAHQVPLGSSQIYKNLSPFSHQLKTVQNHALMGDINVYTSSSYWVIIASLQPLHQIKSTIPCIKSGGYYLHLLLQLCFKLSYQERIKQCRHLHQQLTACSLFCVLLKLYYEWPSE